MRFRAPVLALGGVRADSGFDSAGATRRRATCGDVLGEGAGVAGLDPALPLQRRRRADGFQELAGNGRFWAVPRRGEFQVRVRGCRSSRRVLLRPVLERRDVATGRPGTPLDLRRTAAQPIDSAVDIPVRLAWNPGPNTPASARYELVYGRVGGSGCGTRTIDSCTLLADGGR